MDNFFQFVRDNRELTDAIAQVVGYTCIGAFVAAIVCRAMVWVFDGR